MTIIKRKLFALVMSAVLVLTLLPSVAFAEEDPDGATGTKDTTTSDELNDADVEQEYPVPVSVWYIGVDQGIVGTNELREPGNDLYNGLYTSNHSIEVTYSDASVKTYECLDYSYTDDQGKTVKGHGFILQDDSSTVDPSLESSFVDVYMYEEEKVVFKEGENKVRLQVNVPYTVKDEKTGKDVTEWMILYTDTYVMCKYFKPSKITFVPAKGFKPDVNIGHNYIDEATFYGKGNSFEVFYKETPEDPEAPWFGYTITYKYVKKKTSDGIVEGFFEDGDINKDCFFFSEGMECELKKGSNKITLPYIEFAPVLNKNVKVNFTYNLVASKYSAYANWPIFNYTGKDITKKSYLNKLVVRNTLGAKIPQSAYTVKWTPRKKMGWYIVTINFKDKTKYPASITANFGIGPKTPKLTRIYWGKRRLIVRWKRFTKKELKNINGAYIEVSTDKHFLNNYKKVKVSKKQLKKTYQIVRKLKKNTKYYVRIYTYKKIKQGGETFEMCSSDSNVKAKKTKNK